MNAVKEEAQDESGGLRPAGTTEEHNEDSPKQPKSNLSRCSLCYNHKASMMARWGGDGESSSSAGDSGPEMDSESEVDSLESSFSSSEEDLLERPEDPSTGPGDAGSGGKDGGGREEAPRRAPVVSSSSPVPHLTALSLLPRPHTVVSTLHLQVLTQNHHHNADAVHIVQQQLFGRQEETTGGGNGGEEGVMTPPQPFPWQQAELQWQPTLQQHQLSYQQQYQQQQAQHFCALSAQGQRLPPPMHTLPVPHPSMLHTPLQADSAPHTHLHQPTAPPCWCWYSPYPY